jgi:hypothetical protein
MSLERGVVAEESAALMEDVRTFSFPRAPGGEGERRAGDLVERRFRAAGLDVTRESFRTARHAVFRLRLVGHLLAAFLIVAAAVVASARPGAAATLGIVTLLLFARAGRWSRGLEGAFDLGEMVESENVVGRRAGRNAAALRIVVMAHRDTKSAALPTFVPAVVLLGAVGFTVLLTLLAVGAWGWGIPGPALPVPAFVLAALLVAIVFNPSGDASPGAMDNASGLAVLLAAARDLPHDDALTDAELVFLCTGAEEIGLAGALRWIQRHADEMDESRTVFLNVDSVGVGTQIHAADARGAAPGGRGMGYVVRQAARTAGVPLRLLRVLPAAGVDSMPIGARGFATVTLLGEVLGGASRRFHTARDTVDHLNEAGLQNARRLVGEIARSVALGAPR